MSVLTKTIYDVLATDPTLTDLLSTYKNLPAVFTTDPPPGDATLPYIVTAGDTSQTPDDTKTSRGRRIMRDIRCYAPAIGDEHGAGSVVVIETIAERVRALLHRQPLTIDGHGWILSAVTGPIAADEKDVYGRVITVSIATTED